MRLKIIMLIVFVFSITAYAKDKPKKKVFDNGYVIVMDRSKDARKSPNVKAKLIQLLKEKKPK